MLFAKGRSRAERQFSAFVLAPVVLSFIGAAAFGVAFVFWSAHNADERSLERQTELARHVIQTELASIPRDQESATIWDDAVFRTKPGSVSEVYNVGRYIDRLVYVTGGLQLQERLCVFDSELILNSLIYPI